MLEIDGIEALRLDIQKFERRCPKEIVRVLGKTSITRVNNFIPMMPTRQLAAA